MSDRLAISAVLSVLMMAVYVLFFADVPRVSLGPDGSREEQGELTAELPAAGLPLPDRVLPLTR